MTLTRTLATMIGFRPPPTSPPADKAALDAVRDRLATKTCQIEKDVDEFTKMINRMKRAGKKQNSSARR